MKRLQIFEASDKKTFHTAADCKRHEEALSLNLLFGLDEDRLMAAFNRTDIPLADAIERIGNIIGDKRRESGELRRRSRSAGKRGGPAPEKKP